MIFLDGDRDQAISSFPFIPDEFFIDMESLWKGRVKRIHAEDAFAEVERAAEALSLAVCFGVRLHTFSFISMAFRHACTWRCQNVSVHYTIIYIYMHVLFVTCSLIYMIRSAVLR